MWRASMNVQSLNTSTGDPANLAYLQSYSTTGLKLTYSDNTNGTSITLPTGVTIYGDPPTTAGNVWWVPQPIEPWVPAPQPYEPWQSAPTPWVPQPAPTPFEPTPEMMKALEQIIEAAKKAKEVQEAAPAEKKEAASPEKEEAPIDDSLEEVDVERFRRM